MADQMQQPLPEGTKDTEPLKPILRLQQQPLTKDADQLVGSSKKRRRLKPGYAGDVEFERLEPTDLKSLSVLVQALDNQWLPRSLLQPALKVGEINRGIDRKLRKAVRSEYIRSLINGRQVVLNRAYIYNNPAISQDYTRKGSEREAFRDLLEGEVIVSYLMGEKTPIDSPVSGAGAPVAYNVLKSFERWRELCQEVRVRCVRFSWDEKENWHLTRQRLSKRFNEFATSASAGDIDQYIRDLGLDPSARGDLGKRLVQLGRYCLDLRSKDPDKLVTRNELYKAFVTAGDNPVERKYDSSKLFAGEIKQLLDLAYNCNLPDALGGYLITPVDSMPRTALQEWQPTMRQANQITGEEIVKLLQRTVFSLAQSGLDIKSMDSLSLQDVREIRRMDEWATYIQSQEALLADPLNFADGGVARVYESYLRLAKRMTDLIKEQGRKDEVFTAWTPTIELIFYVAGAMLSCIWTSSGPVYQLLGQVSGIVGAITTPVVARLIIRDRAEKHAEQDLSTSIDFMRYKMVEAKKQWGEIERQVKKLPGYRELAKEEEIVDPTISYQEIEY